MAFAAWVLIVWASIMIISSFGAPFLIGKPRPIYTAGSASIVMAANITMGVLILFLAISSLNGVSA